MSSNNHKREKDTRIAPQPKCGRCGSVNLGVRNAYEGRQYGKTVGFAAQPYCKDCDSTRLVRL